MADAVEGELGGKRHARRDAGCYPRVLVHGVGLEAGRRNNFPKLKTGSYSAPSIIPAAGCQQTELLEVDVGKRILVGRQLVRIGRRLRYREIRRHADRQQPSALQFLDAWQVADL